MSAAAVICPMLITFLGMDPYMAVGIALASDVLASAISAYTYGKSGNLDIKNGAVMMAAVLCFTLVGSYVASLAARHDDGRFLNVHDAACWASSSSCGRVMTTKSAMNAVSVQKRFAQSLLCGAGVGFICGFIGAGGGMMMLLLLTSVLGYELKTAVGTSVFIMAFTAFTGSVSHFADRRCAGSVLPDLLCSEHAALGAHCRQVREQGRACHAEPRDRHRAGRAGCGDPGGELFVISQGNTA